MIAVDMRILVIDDDPIRASIIEEGLRESGHGAVVVSTNVNGVARLIETEQPDVIVIDLANPNRDVMEHMFQISRAADRPIAMFVDQADPSSIEAAVDAGVSAYVIDGLRKERVKPILDVAITRFRAYSRLRDELDAARNALSERKIIERAKGILMSMRKIGEEEAFSMLRRKAMREQRKMSDIAQSIITAAELLDGSDADE